MRGMLAFSDDDTEDIEIVTTTQGGETTDISSSQQLNGSGGGDGGAGNDVDNAAAAPAVEICQAELAPDVNGLIESAIRNRNKNIVIADIVATTPEPPELKFMTKENLMLPPFTSKSDELRYQVEHAILFRFLAPYVCYFSMFAIVLSYVWDVIQPDRSGTLLLHGVLLRIPSAIAVTAMWICAVQPNLKSFFLSYSQWIVVSMFTITSASNTLILYIHDDGYIVGSAFVGTCMMSSSTLGMLRMKHCLIYCGLCLIMCNIVMIFQYYKQEKEDEGNYYSLAYTLLNTNFFLLLFCYFSIFFCYVMELHLRQRYRDSGTIFRWMSTSNNNNNQRRQ